MGFCQHTITCLCAQSIIGFSNTHQGIPRIHSLCKLGSTLVVILLLKSPQSVVHYTYPVVCTTIPSTSIKSWTSSFDYAFSLNAVTIASDTKVPIAPESSNTFFGHTFTKLDNSITRPQSRKAETISSVGPLRPGFSHCGSHAITLDLVLPLLAARDRYGAPSPISVSALSTTF